MDDGIQDGIGNTVDALLRPRTALAPSGVLRVADLYAGELGHAARSIRLEVVYTHQPGETVGDISGYDQIPPFDVLCANLPDGAWEEAFTFALRFLRVRRPAAFLLVGAQADLLHPVQERTQRLGYGVSGNDGFIVGVIWSEPFTWPSGLTVHGVMAQVAQHVLDHMTA